MFTESGIESCTCISHIGKAVHELERDWNFKNQAVTARDITQPSARKSALTDEYNW